MSVNVYLHESLRVRFFIGRVGTSAGRLYFLLWGMRHPWGLRRLETFYREIITSPEANDTNSILIELNIWKKGGSVKREKSPLIIVWNSYASTECRFVEELTVTLDRIDLLLELSCLPPTDEIKTTRLGWRCQQELLVTTWKALWIAKPRIWIKVTHRMKWKTPTSR